MESFHINILTPEERKQFAKLTERQEVIEFCFSNLKVRQLSTKLIQVDEKKNDKNEDFARRLRESGNEVYRQRKWEKALEFYTNVCFLNAFLRLK